MLNFHLFHKNYEFHQRRAAKRGAETQGKDMLHYQCEEITRDIILPVHEAQVLTYLRLLGKQVGLLINFNVPILKKGIRRCVLNAYEEESVEPDWANF